MSEHDAVVERVAGVVVDYLELGHMPGAAGQIAVEALAALKPGDDLGNGLIAAPKEPTEAMVKAGMTEVDKGGYYVTRGYINDDDGVVIYRAMIAAACEDTREPDAYEH